VNTWNHGSSLSSIGVIKINQFGESRVRCCKHINHSDSSSNHRGAVRWVVDNMALDSRHKKKSPTPYSSKYGVGVGLLAKHGERSFVPLHE
jgi:hypothetical protein